MQISGWIASILFTLGGGIVYILCRLFRPLHDAEVEGMKREGRFEDEPEYMQQFRVTRAELDLESNMRYTRYAAIAFWVGVIGIIVLVITM